MMTVSYRTCCEEEEERSIRAAKCHVQAAMQRVPHNQRLKMARMLGEYHSLANQLCVKQEDTSGFTRLAWHASTSTHNNNSELNRLAQGGITERCVTVSAAVVVVVVVNGLIRLSSRSAGPNFVPSLALWPPLIITLIESRFLWTSMG